MLRLLLSILIVCITAFLPVFVAGKDADTSLFTVVIDPGHGGKDFGCIGKLTNEKTIVLDVAKRLNNMISKQLDNVDVIMTRSDDRFISLNERAAIANKAGADLFVSIHVNSVDKRNRNRANIHGASVYTLGLHRTDDNLAVAMRENSVIELEQDFSEIYQGFDPGSSESYIIFELTQNLHQQQSIDFANAVQNELISTADRADKGVLQSGFLVLRATSMPAVLVELDFICNSSAERFLNSSEGREKCARGILNALESYVKKRGSVAPPKTAKTRRVEPNTEAATRSTHKNGEVKSSADSKTGKVTYGVQFMATKKKIGKNDHQLRKVKNWKKYVKPGGMVCYYTGEYKTMKEAKKCLDEVKKSFPQAFIIKMRNGERIDD